MSESQLLKWVKSCVCATSSLSGRANKPAGCLVLVSGMVPGSANVQTSRVAACTGIADPFSLVQLVAQENIVHLEESRSLDVASSKVTTTSEYIWDRSAQIRGSPTRPSSPSMVVQTRSEVVLHCKRMLCSPYLPRSPQVHVPSLPMCCVSRSQSHDI